MANKIFEDTFTEASVDTVLDVHTPDIGTGWTRVGQWNGEEIEARSATDDARPVIEAVGGYGAVYTADATYSSNDYQIIFDAVVVPGSDDYVNIFIRYQDINNYYVLRVGDKTTSVDTRLFRVVAGVQTQIGVWDNSDGLAIGEGDTIILQIVGSEIGVYDASTEIGYILITDASHSAAGKAALGFGAYWEEVAGDTADGQVIDNFKVEELQNITKSGFQDPTSTGNVDNDFTNPTNAYASNGDLAVGNAQGDKQDYGDFGFSIVAGSLIHGISVKVEAEADSALAEIFGVEVSHDGGSTWSAQKTVALDLPSTIIYHFGHAETKWGRTWSASELNDGNFLVRFTYVTESSTLREVELDHVAVQVYYTPLSTETKAFTVDGVVFATNIVTFTVDGIVLAQTDKTFTVDGIVLAQTNKTFTVDGVVLATTIQAFTSDGVVKVQTDKTFTVDGVVLAETTETFTIDGIVLAETTKTFTVDGVVLAETTKTFTVDGVVLAQTTKTFTVDGVVQAQTTKTFTVDGIVSDIKQLVFTVDGIVLAQTDETVTVDGIVLEISIEIFTVDGRVVGTGTIEFTVDAVIVIDYYRLGTVVLPRPDFFSREYVYLKTDMKTLNGKTARDYSYQKEKYLIGWDLLKSEQAEQILTIVNTNQVVAFSISDGNLSIASVNVHTYIGSKQYVVVGSDYRVSLMLELIEEVVI